MRSALLLAVALLPTLSGCLGHVLDDRRESAPPASATASDAPTDDSSPPGRACTSVGEGIVALAERAGLRPMSLVPDGDRVWLVNDETPPATDRAPYPTPAVGAWAVTTPGGFLARSDIEDFAGALVTFEGDLAYVRRGRENLQIVLRDRTTGDERVVRTVENASVGALVSQPSGLYWTTSSPAPSTSLFRFAGGRVSELSKDAPSSYGLIADASDAYFLARRGIDDDRSELRLEALPIAGGEARVVYRIGDDPRFDWSLIGTSADEIFVAVRGTQLEPSSIRAIAKDGSRQRIVVRVGAFATQPVLEGDLLTWIDGDTGRSILQTTLVGGTVTRFETSNDGRRLASVGIDRCNVYWTAVGEMRTGGATIYAKARGQAAR